MQHYLPYLQWLDHNVDQMKELVLSWSNINTHFLNYQGLEQQSEEIKKHLLALGAEIEEVAVSPYTTIDEHGNKKSHPLGKALVATKRKESSIHILLSGHMDTVFPKHASFQRASETNHETLCGPGVCDMKGGLVVMLYALKALEKSPYKDSIGWQVVITPDEEIGSESSKPLLEKLAKQNMLGLVFEPAKNDGSMVDARCASMNLVFCIRGKSAHAGRDFDQGRSALITACELAHELHACNTPDLIVNVGELHSGHGCNVVADLAILRVNIRAMLEKTLDAAQEQIKALTAKYRVLDGIWIEEFTQSYRPAMPRDASSKKVLDFIQKCAHDLDQHITFSETFGVSDANILTHAGLVSIDTLGPIGKNLHTPNEYVVTQSLADRAKLSALLLMCIGNKELTLDMKNQIIEL